MKWRGLERSKNVEDRRRAGPVVAGGVGGLGLIGLLIALLTGGGNGFDMGGMLDQLQAPTQQPAQTIPADAQPDDESAFVEAVLGTTETYWGDVFATVNRTYEPPTLVLFTGATQSGCGGATSQVGPHYCPLDRTIYVDLDFFDELQQRFGAQGGDFAEAYVIAHEVGHHVQNLLGISDQVRSLQQSNPGAANELSVRLELQADCLAGTWGNSVFERGVLEQGDIQEGLDAAAAVGDDRIQASVQGRIDPESWTHGSAEQRVTWFTRGYESGDPNQCDTFGGGI